MNPSVKRSPGLFAYLGAQFFGSTLDAPQTIKHERVYNFVNVPHRLEQVQGLAYDSHAHIW